MTEDCKTRKQIDPTMKKEDQKIKKNTKGRNKTKARGFDDGKNEKLINFSEEKITQDNCKATAKFVVVLPK